MAEYQPGVCNIGAEEVSFRRRAGHAGAVATGALLVTMLAVGAPRAARVLLVLPAAGAASGYLQARSHFCARYGSQGVYNVGGLGQVAEVVDAEARAADRARSRRIGLQSLGIGLAVAAVAVALPAR